MFELEYCDNLENIQIKSSGITLDVSVAAKYENACRTLENFIYLIDRFKIIRSCAEDLYSVNTVEKDYWKVNKALLNYVNAVYSFKELANGFIPPIKPLTEKYYQKCKWYRFVCDFRNSVIHDSVISTNYDKEEAYIIIDRLIDIQKHRKVKKNQEKNKKRQIAYLEHMKKKAKYIDGKYYYGIKQICKETSTELEEMEKELIIDVYSRSIISELEWLFSILYKNDENYMYTFIVNKEIGPKSVCEPNYLLEDFYIKIKETLGENSEVFCELKKLFHTKGYINFFG